MARAAKSSSKSVRFHHYEFPYVKFHGRFYPLIPLTLTRGAYSVRTFALLDSGASISVFRPEIARALHINIKQKGNVRLATGSGGVNIGVSRLDVQVRSTFFKAKIGFSSTYAASFNILGREGFFHRFSICFNEVMKTVVMVPLEVLRA